MFVMLALALAFGISGRGQDYHDSACCQQGQKCPEPVVLIHLMFSTFWTCGDYPAARRKLQYVLFVIRSGRVTGPQALGNVLDTQTFIREQYDEVIDEVGGFINNFLLIASYCR